MTDDIDNVGYGKPPRKHQFEKGRSGIRTRCSGQGTRASRTRPVGRDRPARPRADERKLAANHFISVHCPE